MTAHLFIHVQHLLGIGHQQRADAIATACLAQGMAVTMATGDGSADPATVGYTIAGLPDMRSADALFSGLVDMAGHPVDDAYWARRREALLAAFDAARPDVLLVEGFPFARRAFRKELIPLLQRAQDRGVPVLCSLRDILQPKTRPDRVRETLETVRSFFDAVLVHGDPSFAPLSLSFAAVGEIAVPILYTGYVSPEMPFDRPALRTQDVVVSAGGGAVGQQLYEAAFAAAMLEGADGFRWRLRIGRNAAFADAAPCPPPDHVLIEEAGPDFRPLLAQAAVSISQAGYNTAVDLILTGAPAILVPYSDGGQVEQTLRAERMRAVFGATVLDAADLTPGLLWDQVARRASLSAPAEPDRPAIDAAGAQRTAAILAAWARGDTRSALECGLHEK